MCTRVGFTRQSALVALNDGELRLKCLLDDFDFIFEVVENLEEVTVSWSRGELRNLRLSTACPYVGV